MTEVNLQRMIGGFKMFAISQRFLAIDKSSFLRIDSRNLCLMPAVILINNESFISEHFNFKYVDLSLFDCDRPDLFIDTTGINISQELMLFELQMFFSFRLHIININIIEFENIYIYNYI